MKIAIVTANFGDYDENIKPCEQTLPFDYHCISETNSPIPLPHLNDGLKSRYYRIRMHEYLPDYTHYVWIDGRVEITSNRFLEMMLEKLGGNEIAIHEHNERATVGQELDFIIKEIVRYPQGVLARKRGNEPFRQEREFYTRHNALQAKLYCTGVFMRKNDQRVNRIFDEWFIKCIEYSNFDQSEFAYIAHTMGLKVSTLRSFRTPKRDDGIIYETDYLKIWKHKKRY